VRDLLAWQRVDLRDWAALTSNWHTARLRLSRTRPHSSRRHPGGRRGAAKLAEGRIKAVLLPEFSGEDHLLFLAER
jgi:hypothetical protein